MKKKLFTILICAFFVSCDHYIDVDNLRVYAKKDRGNGTVEYTLEDSSIQGSKDANADSRINIWSQDTSFNVNDKVKLIKRE